MRPPARPPPELIDDAIAEILLRVPPDDPAHLVCASLVCKPWRRVLSDRDFLRRYRAFHRAPPMLGFLQFLSDAVTLFVPTTAVPHLSFPSFCWKVLDCRHGRVLLGMYQTLLFVWDPILGNGKKLAFPTHLKFYLGFTATVLCAADGCDHLECRSGPFLVVFVGSGTNGDIVNATSWVSVYSSETGAWSAPTLIQLNSFHIKQRPGLLIGDALYFTLEREEYTEYILKYTEYILKYDLTDGILSVIEAPYLDQELEEGIVITTIDGGLGFAGIKATTLFLWSWNDGPPDDIAGWVQHRAIELLTLLPTPRPFSLIGFAEGTDTIFVTTNAGVYTIELKSEKTRKVGTRGSHVVVPYMSFYTPDLAEASCQHLKDAVVRRLCED